MKDRKQEESEQQNLGEVLEFMRALWAVDHGLQATSKRMKVQLGVTGPQRLVIRLVGRFPGISAGRLAEILHVHPSTLTGVLRRLETRGFLERKTDPKDGRRALFALTPRGKELDVDQEGTVEFAVRHALQKLSPAQITAAQEVFRALTESLGADE
ncbi:MAG: MarR family winged helix-turn-helix transcriptional regulator [Myxococcales bacterium]